MGLESYILKAFAASLLLAVITVILAMGLIFAFHYGMPLPIFLVLILAAISFVLSAAFFERYEVGSIVWSLMVSIIGTGILTLISGGVIYLFAVSDIRWEELLSGIAVSMIVCMAMLSYLKRSLAQIESY